MPAVSLVVVTAALLCSVTADAATRPIKWEAGFVQRSGAPSATRKLPVPAAGSGSHAVALGLRDWACKISRELVSVDGRVIDAVTLACTTPQRQSVSVSVSCDVTDEATEGHGVMSLGDASATTVDLAVTCSN